MFVIADARHVVPSYVFKVLPDGMGLITVDLAGAMLFKTKREASEVFGTICKTDAFVFAIHELSIKNHQPVTMTTEPTPTPAATAETTPTSTDGMPVAQPIQANDIVIPDTTSAKLEYAGVPGYAVETNDTTTKVAFYHAEVPGENAYVVYHDFLNAQLYRVGPCNPDMVPNPPVAEEAAAA